VPSGHSPNQRSRYVGISVRLLARAIILLRRLRSAFRLGSSRSAGIDENAASIAMSFASAKLTFINCNSCSILSKLRFDKSFSRSVCGCDYKRSSSAKQRRSLHNEGMAKKQSATLVVVNPNISVSTAFGTSADMNPEQNRCIQDRHLVDHPFCRLYWNS